MPIAALVCGIVGLVVSIVPCLGWFALPITLVAVILGVLGMKPPKDGSPQKGKGLAVAGLVMGIIGTLIAAYWLYVFLTLRGHAEDAMKDGWKQGIHDMQKDMDKNHVDKDLDDSLKDLKNLGDTMKDMKKDLDKLQPDKPAEAPAETPPPADK